MTKSSMSGSVEINTGSASPPTPRDEPHNTAPSVSPRARTADPPIDANPSVPTAKAGSDSAEFRDDRPVDVTPLDDRKADTDHETRTP